MSHTARGEGQVKRGSARSVMDSVAGSGHGISHSTNTLRKGINPTDLLSAMCNIVGQTDLFNLGMESGRDRRL